MTRFVVGDDRSQSTLFPERLDDYLGEDNPVLAIDVFIDELDLAKLGFGGVEPEATGRPAYHPATLLKIYVYGYLNRVQSSRRLERECQRNIELVWLTGRLMPDFKTIADFRKDNGEAIRRVCREFVMLCRRSGTGSQDHPAQREDCDAARGDSASERSEYSDDADRGQADIANRSRCALDGYKWPRQRDGRLQCAKCGRYEAPSHCYP